MENSKSNIVPFRSRLELERLRFLDALETMPSIATDPDEKRHYENWLSGPADDWIPGPEHIGHAIALAEAYYASGNGDDDYGFDQFVDDIVATEDTVLAGLNDAQCAELVGYGEASEWEDMSASKFVAWRRWKAAPAP